MIFESAKIGDRVYHRKFKKGTIKKLISDNKTITVEFDEEQEGKKVRTMLASFLDLLPEEKSSEANVNIPPKTTSYENKNFEVGTRVYCEEYGDGIVICKKGFFKSEVRFEKRNLTEVILNIKLSIVDDDLIDDDELIDEEINTRFRVIPSNYSEQSCYSTYSKRLLSFLRKKYKDDGLATIKSYSDVGGGTIGAFLVPDKGVIVFYLIETDFPIDALYSPLFEQVNKSKFERLSKYYLESFLQSKNMCTFVNDSDKVLKFPMKFIFLFQNMDISKLDKSKVKLVNHNYYFKNFSSCFDNNDLFSNFNAYDENFNVIDAKLYGSIVERVVPENATLVTIAPKELKKAVVREHNPEFYPITGEEREFSALYLDDIQIKTINETKPGHYLTLANPGTGKSVILVSKAYRIQSIKNDNHVLITCYNNNLAEHHRIFAEVSGMKTANLHIDTFHKFAKDLVSKIDSKFVQTHDLSKENNFDLLVNRFEELVNLGKIETKLNAIFIDEVQLFDPKWIDICYKLLDKSNDKDYFFEMYGDINQDVKSQHSKGKASWQNTKAIPSLQGRVRKLDKNYRNTDLIANYLGSVISEFNNFLNSHGIPIDKDSSCLTSETIKKGSLRTKILLSASDSVSKVSRIIKELIEKKNADYSEIAVIYPAKGFGKYYRPLYHIENEFDKNNIPYSLIHGIEINGRDRRQRLFECDGVIMSTIDSCLGLDFKYVILCGIHYWDFMRTETGFKELDRKMLLFDKKAQLYFSEIGKKIYSACSRAREGLYIVDDLNSSSPIKDILRPKSGRSYYDEY